MESYVIFKEYTQFMNRICEVATSFDVEYQTDG